MTDLTSQKTPTTEYIHRLVDAAPPPRPEQLAHITALLGPALSSLSAEVTMLPRQRPRAVARRAA